MRQPPRKKAKSRIAKKAKSRIARRDQSRITLSGGVAMPRAKSKRTRDYEFNATWFERDFEAELDAAKEDFEAETAAPKGSGFKPATNKRLHGYLAAWMRDMKAWGENVRDDIIRLEAAVRMAPGEPGDPPPAPRVR